MKIATRLLAAAAIAGAAIAAPSVASAQNVTTAGFTNTAFPANDDGYTDPVALGFSANFFGTTYTNTQVSNNGYLTFGGGQYNYTPTGLASGYSGLPIIAAFYADVDTRGANSGLMSYGTGTYAGHNAFDATWNAVGYYGAHSDKLNTFQIILTDRSDTGTGNFDIYFNYDQIQWETGDASGGSNGFGGTPAAVGYNAGQPGDPAGTYYQLPGSLQTMTFEDTGSAPLKTTTNDGVPGQLLFQVRNGQVAPPPPPPAVPELGTWAMMIAGFGMVGYAMRRRQKVRVSFAA